MEFDEEKILDPALDIDLIKDEQNPVYQNVDIHRQRLMSIIDRALEKISIAYALEDMLGDEIDVLRDYVSQQEINSILNIFKHARHLEDAPVHVLSTVMRRSAFFRSSHSTKYIDTSSYDKSSVTLDSNNPSKSFTSSISITPSILQDKSQDDKGNSLHAELVRSYFNSIIITLHFIPEVSNIAKNIVYKKPVGSIKYYVYLKDLRNHVLKMIYETKTEESNHRKNIKLAYVRNLKEKPQAEVINKILRDKHNERIESALKLQKEIENEKLIQAEMNLKLLCDAADRIFNSEKEIIARTEESHIIQEENKVILAECVASYNKELAEDISSIQVLRKRVKKLEVTYKKILDNYDTAIGELHEVFETINEGYLKEEAMYNDLKKKFDAQEEYYEELMEEKKQYIEMNCLRIRYNRATRIIQRWWRNILVKRWKWRKTYLAKQLMRKSLTKDQRKKMNKIMKKIREKQKLINKKFQL